MATTETESELTAPERLAVLAALGELTPAEQAEWKQVREADPALRHAVDDWTAIVGALEEPRIPPPVLAQLDAARQSRRPSPSDEPLIAPYLVHASACSDPSLDTLKREPPTLAARRFTAFYRVSLALAACVALSLILVQDGTPPPLEDGIKSTPPVVFPATPVEWQAPGAETRLLQPAIVFERNSRPALPRAVGGRHGNGHRLGRIRAVPLAFGGAADGGGDLHGPFGTGPLHARRPRADQGPACSTCCCRHVQFSCPA